MKDITALVLGTAITLGSAGFLENHVRNLEELSENFQVRNYLETSTEIYHIKLRYKENPEKYNTGGTLNDYGKLCQAELALSQNPEVREYLEMRHNLDGSLGVIGALFGIFLMVTGTLEYYQKRKSRKLEAPPIPQ